MRNVPADTDIMNMVTDIMSTDIMNMNTGVMSTDIMNTGTVMPAKIMKTGKQP